MPNANGHNGNGPEGQGPNGVGGGDDAHHDQYVDRGPQEIEIWKPTGKLTGYFDVQVHDVNGIDPTSIIKEEHDWDMSFELWLHGDLWKCVCGTLCPDVFFERANDGARFKLSDLVGHDLRHEFRGCDAPYEDGKVHVQWRVTVPAGKLPSGPEKPGIYDWKASLGFEDPCGNRGVLAGRDRGEIQVWAQDAPHAVPA